MSARWSGNKGGELAGGRFLPSALGGISRRGQKRLLVKRTKAVCDLNKEFLLVDRSDSLVPYETVSRTVARGFTEDVMQRRAQRFL